MRRQKRPFCPQKTWKSVRLIWKFHWGTQSRRRVEGLNTGLHEYVWQGKKEPESSAGHLLRLLVISGHLSQLSGGSNGMELKWPQAGFGVERGAEVKYKCIHEDSHSLMDFLSGNIQFVAHSWNSSEQCFWEVGVRGYVCMFQMLFWTINLNAVILIIVVIFFFLFPWRTACLHMERCAFIILQILPSFPPQLRTLRFQPLSSPFRNNFIFCHYYWFVFLQLII